MLGPRSNSDQMVPEGTRPPDPDCETDLVPKADDVRLSKVFAARCALRGDKYDSEAVLDEVVRRLTDALEIKGRG